MARLVVESGVDGGMIFPLSTATVTLGRSVSNSIQIIDRKMSRHHGEIRYRGGAYHFCDMGSKNGSVVNGKKVRGEVPLEDGDRIRMGETLLVFEAEPEKEPELEDTTSRGIRIVEDLEWGQTRGSVAAGAQPPIELEMDLDREEALKDMNQRLAILYKVADAIRNILNLDELLDQLMNIIYDVIQPDRGFIMLKDEGTGELVPASIKKRDDDSDEIAISSTIVKRCVKDRVSILVSDAANDQRFSASESVILNRIRSAICSPLIFKDEVLGVIYVDTQSRILSYSQEELELVNGIANQSAMAIANAKLHSRIVEQQKSAREMEIARTIQMNLLPKIYPSVDNLDISAMSLPAKQVGGDYYDFITLPDGRVGITIADVSGKGVPAAILLATTRASLLLEAEQSGAGVKRVISRLNAICCRDATNNMYVTMIYGILDPGKSSFEYVNAGHVYGLLFDSKNRVKRLKTGGSFLGIMENAEYQSEKIQFEPGQTLALYSDGVTDTMNENGDLFGLERLKKVLAANLKRSAKEIRDAVREACLDFRKGADQFDDFTLVIIKII